MIIDEGREKYYIDKKLFNEEKNGILDKPNKVINEFKENVINKNVEKDVNQNMITDVMQKRKEITENLRKKIRKADFKNVSDIKQSVREKKGIASSSKSSKEFKLYLIICSVYLIGIILGIVYFKLISKEPEIKDRLVGKFLEIDNKDLVNKENLIKEIVFRNMKNIMLFWIVGASAIGSPFLVLFMLYKGFSISFTSSIILSAVGILEGNKFIFGSLFLYSALEVIAMMILLISALKVSVNVIINKKDVRYEIIRHSLVTLACVPIFVISSIIEYVMC